MSTVATFTTDRWGRLPIPAYVDIDGQQHPVPASAKRPCGARTVAVAYRVETALRAAGWASINCHITVRPGVNEVPIQPLP